MARLWNSFSIFFKLLKLVLLHLIKEYHKTSNILGLINSTFIALIPKVSIPDTFLDFRPISLCNIVYKLISKIIVECLKNSSRLTSLGNNMASYQTN